MRTRLRPAYSDLELQAMYFEASLTPPWHGHAERIRVTAEIGKAMWRGGRVADLSCGDAAITTAMGVPDELLTLGDLALGSPMQRARWCGRIEQLIDMIEPVELFICSETLEHIDDPDTLLAKIHDKCEALLLSTPEDETRHNSEHYWAWGKGDIATMLFDAGFRIVASQSLTIDGFTFQIWEAR